MTAWSIGPPVPCTQTGGSWVFGGGLALASHNPRCSRMARITCLSSMKLMIRMVPRHFVPEDRLQLFQLQGRGDTEHAIVSVKASIGDENVAVGIESEEIAEGLDGDDGAGDGILLRNRLLDKYLQGFPGTPAQISKKFPIVQKVAAQDLRDTEAVLPGEMVVIDLKKGLEMVLHTALIIRILRVSWAINSGR